MVLVFLMLSSPHLCQLGGQNIRNMKVELLLELLYLIVCVGGGGSISSAYLPFVLLITVIEAFGSRSRFQIFVPGRLSC